MNVVRRIGDVEVAPQQSLESPRHVAILMGLFNGARFLPEQLASIAAQRHGNWSLVVGDDGSEDEGREIVADFALENPDRPVTIVDGPGRGFQANFLALLGHLPVSPAFTAFADQDDVWLPGKLGRAIEALEAVDPTVPALYGSRTIVTNEALERKGLSPDFRKPPSFQNALVQSIAGGNTMVLNRAGLELLRRAAAGTGAIVSHDWWAYQVISGAGGTVLYDREPQVLYRQHGRNLIGAQNGLLAKLDRLRRLLAGEFSAYSETNLEALRGIRDFLTPENQRRLDDFGAHRGASPHQRLRLLRRSGVCRQTFAGTVALWIAAAINRI